MLLKLNINIYDIFMCGKKLSHCLLDSLWFYLAMVPSCIQTVSSLHGESPLCSSATILQE